jgi:cell wall-associated NlpC family hydrolase
MISSINELQPGDLVFFAGTYAAPGITHNAIYVGNGRIVSAGTPQTGVALENINAPSWSSKWVGGLRPYR